MENRRNPEIIVGIEKVISRCLQDTYQKCLLQKKKTMYGIQKFCSEINLSHKFHVFHDLFEVSSYIHNF